MTELSVREGQPSDLPSLGGLDERVRSDPLRRASLVAHLSDAQCLIAEAGGELLGFVLWDYSFFGCSFIPLIVVAASHRRRGVGLRLLRGVEARCTRAKLFTSANASNDAAQALYGRAGFVPSGVIENLDEGDPELVFYKACDGRKR